MSKEPITSYHTVSETSEAEFRDRGSRFIGYLVPVADREALEITLEEFRQMHPKSRHVCYGYRLGTQQMNEIEEYANDAGEPSGSAGLPILHTLKSADIIQVVGVVVRYFGGTKLGIPGLINAYKTCMTDAVAANRIISKEVIKHFTLTAGFAYGHKAYPIIEQFRGKATQAVRDEQYMLSVDVPLQHAKPFEAAINVCHGVSIVQENN